MKRANNGIRNELEGGEGLPWREWRGYHDLEDLLGVTVPTLLDIKSTRARKPLRRFLLTPSASDRSTHKHTPGKMVTYWKH